MSYNSSNKTYPHFKLLWGQKKSIRLMNRNKLSFDTKFVQQ